MKCHRCGSEDLSVVDSRSDGNAIRRRRECQSCHTRFNTFERAEIALPSVVKKDGRRELFDREKVRGGMLKSCQKRPVASEVIDRATENVERKVAELGVDEIPSLKVGDFVMEELREIDQVAYVRFASVYREFSDVSQFVDTLNTLAESPAPPTRRSRRARGAVVIPLSKEEHV